MKQQYLMLIYSILLLLFRRWLGTSSKKTVSRSIKVIVLALILVCMFFTSGHNVCIEMLSIPFLIWCMVRGHGDYFFVYDKDKDEGRIKTVDKILQWIFGKDGYYNFKGNITGLFLTRLFPSLLAAYFLPYMVFFPVCYALTYAIVEGIMKANNEDEYISCSEYVNGFIFALLIYGSLV